MNLLQRAAERAPDAAALIDRDGVLSFAQLYALAKDAAQGLLAAHGTSRLPVPIVAANDRASVALIHGALGAQVPLLLLHARLTPPEREAMVAGLSLSAIGTPDDTAVIICSSGSTGSPKGIGLSQRALIASARASAERLGWSASDRWLCALPLAHVAGLSILIRCALAERPLILLEGFDPERLLFEAAAQQASLVSLVPLMLSRLVERSLSPPASLRAALLGGAPASVELVDAARDLGWPVLKTYGLSEMASQVSLQAPGDRGHDAGRALAGVELRIVEGRIQLRGPMLFSGYWPRDGQTQGPDAAGWFATGDLGELDSSGRLWVLGRADDWIVGPGEKVNPAEVEAVLLRAPGIRQAVVFGSEQPGLGPTVSAALVVERGFDRGALLGWLGSELAPFKCPRRWAVLDALPTTASGKIDRATLRRTARDALQVW